MTEGSDGLTADTRQYLTQLWAQHLNVPSIGINDDFFEAGGSSMQAIEMLMAVSTRYGREVDYAEFFMQPCISRLGQLLDA